jgi:hypothetical protein
MGKLCPFGKIRFVSFVRCSVRQPKDIGHQPDVVVQLWRTFIAIKGDCNVMASPQSCVSSRYVTEDCSLRTESVAELRLLSDLSATF